MDVLSVTPEVFPLIKTGGLGDVAGALPGALAAQDVRVRTLVPGYRTILKTLRQGRVAAKFDMLFGGSGRLIAGRAAGLELLVLDAPHLFDRAGGPYSGADGQDFDDNWARFGALGLVGAQIGGGLVEGYNPQIVHAHDWQGALAPVYMRYGGNGAAKSVLSVHNLAFQGQFSADVFSGLGLPQAAFSLEGMEFYGGVGFLKGGLTSADAIVTVSPTYAREITRTEAGMGLDGVLRSRLDDLYGFVNGIDTGVWDPATDAALEAQFSPALIKKREINRQALEARFSLEADGGPLIAVISRLTEQKGIDLLLDTADQIVGLPARLIVLGSGEATFEKGLLAVAAKHAGRVGVKIGYDEGLAHLMQGGADAILIPSRFEPCGLTQLYGLRYGAVPIVARVGGLNDTIIDANIAAVNAGVATGVQFWPVNGPSLLEAVARMVQLYKQPAIWRKLVRRGMKTDVSWRRSAEAYADLYRALIKGKTN
ncbi:MAG: glycogen synthase GlgA [Alphaproteobacteria bacterium]|nr:glycogen synthase GlgA [Alphaproteobacteria bacterium]